MSLEKVRILILGDSGVGKTCLSHLMAHHECLPAASSTIGCNIEVKLHEYKEGTPEQKTYFIELCDIGGRPCYANTRHMFYNTVHGMVLVHDLTNRKSQENLSKWLAEVMNRDSEFDNSADDFDPEAYVGTSKIPILLIGTKADLVRDANLRRTSSMADEYGAEEILVNALSAKSLAAGTGAAVKLDRFFDKVIQVKFYSPRQNNSWTYSLPKKEFDIILSPVDDNTCPVVHIPGEHCMGIKSWCVKPLYQFLYRNLIGAKQEMMLGKQTLLMEERHHVEALLNTALLLNPEVATLWNMRRELVTREQLHRPAELRFASLVSSFKPKTSDVFVYRRWILSSYLIDLADAELIQVLSSEFDAVFKAATDYPNNYNAWNHGLWCLNFAPLQLKRAVLNTSTSWTRTHVSDHSGLQFRQQLLLSLLDVCEDDSCSQCPPWYQLYKQNNRHKIEYIDGFIHELSLTFDLITQYPGHEALWYHRRFLVHSLLARNLPETAQSSSSLRELLLRQERELKVDVGDEVNKTRYLRWLKSFSEAEVDLSA